MQMRLQQAFFDATIPDDDKEITDFIQHDEDNAEEKAK